MRVLPVVALIGLLILSAFTMAASGDAYRFDDCPSGHDCVAMPTGAPFPPDLVTGHTTYAKYHLIRGGLGPLGTDGEPTSHRFPSTAAPRAGPTPSGGPIGPEPASIREGGSLVQAECVSWADGHNLDVRPERDPDVPGEIDANGFFSDEDSAEGAAQDYDPNRELASCLPGSGGEAFPPHFGRPTDFASLAGMFVYEVPETPWSPGSISYGNFAILVESGDCPPMSGIDFRYRGHLDFVDPNSIYHEVQEYDYVCGGTTHGSGPGGNPVPGAQGIASGMLADSVKELFPWTYTDPANADGCDVYHAPDQVVDPGVDQGEVDPNDPSNATTPSIDPRVDPAHGYFDLGHKCNGSIQDLFTERLWITPVHEPIFDPTLLQEYTFALAVDTCSGRNIQEEFLGVGRERDVDALDYLLDSIALQQPLVEVCFDGSSFSFDDTGRARTTHYGAPAGQGSEEVMRGNSFSFDPNEPNFAMHRNNCRHNFIAWSWNNHPGPNPAQSGPGGQFGDAHSSTVGDDCYPEDHRTAPIDLYVSDQDPTGQFALYSNGYTGANAYVSDPVTGPDWTPH